MFFDILFSRGSSLLCLGRKILAVFAIVALLFEQFLFIFFSSALLVSGSPLAVAADLPLAVDGSTNTVVTKTASGVDQVNIAAPNAAGLSHNRFSDYNVNQSGQIINNFSGKNLSEVVAGSGANAVTATQIGGLVTVNQNLANSGAAKIILNEVTSGNVSKLMGYTEIAGTKSNLILANPNGITCSGCGFINTAHLVMVGGASNFDSSGKLGFI